MKYEVSDNFKEECKIWWDGLTNCQKEIFQTIPNFDKDIFKEVTGIDIETEKNVSEPKFGEWIPITSKVIHLDDNVIRTDFTCTLPHENEYVLMCACGGSVFIDAYRSKTYKNVFSKFIEYDAFTLIENRMLLRDVIAWMPLPEPEPYKREVE